VPQVVDAEPVADPGSPASGQERNLPPVGQPQHRPRRAGYEQVYDIDEIITRMPTPDEVARLAISTGTPVAEHIRTGYTASDRAVRVMISVIPATR